MKDRVYTEQEAAERYHAHVMAAVREYCATVGISAELEVSLQALKEENAMLRDELRIGNDEAARLYDFARDKGAALERASVVAWVCSQGVIEGSSPDERNMARWLARCIECGEHRR